MMAEGNVERTEVGCPLCGSHDLRPVVVEYGWPIVRCRRCSLIHVNPQPVRGASEDVEYLGGIGDGGLGDDARIRSALDDLDRLTDGRHGRILDVGSGYGRFLAAARDRGWDPYGVDVSKVGVEHAHGLGLENVERTDLFERAYPDHWFDVVTIWNVLEHVTEPAALLDEARRLLTDDGLVVVRVPNMIFHHLLWRVLSLVGVFQRRKMHYLGGVPAPQHLFGFTPATLTRFAERADLRVVELAPAVPHFATDPKRRLISFLASGLHRLSRGRLVVSPTMLLFARPASRPVSHEV